MALFKTDGAEIFHQCSGKGDPVLLTHGIFATGDMWSKQLEEILDGYCLISWDMRGHGRSSSPEEASHYSEKATVNDMRLLLDHYGAERAVLVGHSLGGYMSLAFWLKYPQRVSALVLESTGPGYRSDEARAQWNRFAHRQADKLEKEGLDHLSKYPDIDGSLHRSVDGLIHAVKGMMIQRDDKVINALPKIDVPTLVVIGEQDVWLHDAATYMTSKLKHGELISIPEAGHLPNITHPAYFNRELRLFLNRPNGEKP
jgi:pimeloyl-ACP methyl ester carboxylesterase